MVAIRGGVQWLAEAAWGVQRRHAEVACRGGGSMYQRRSAASRGSVLERRRGCTLQWVGAESESLAAVARTGMGHYKKLHTQTKSKLMGRWKINCSLVVGVRRQLKVRKG